MAPSNILLVKKDDEVEKAKRQMLLCLPPEILGKIFLLTSLQTRAKVLSSVCESLNYFIFNHDLLWSKLNLNALKNISDTTIPLIFHNNLPANTRLCIRELYLNDVSITIESVQIVLTTCKNLKSLHLRTVRNTLEMSSLRQLIEDLFCPEEEKSERISQGDIENQSGNSEDIPPLESFESIGDEIERAEVATNQNGIATMTINDGGEGPENSTVDSVTPDKIPLRVPHIDHPCQLQTIYWYLDHDEWVWWSPREKSDLENILRKLTNNPKASIQVPWCDFCNRQQASFQVKCIGNSHVGRNEGNWFYYGCFECTEFGGIQDYKCDACVMAAQQTQQAEEEIVDLIENLNAEISEDANGNVTDTGSIDDNGNAAAAAAAAGILYVQATDGNEARGDDVNGEAVVPQGTQDGGINGSEEIVQADEDGYVVITELRNNDTRAVTRDNGNSDGPSSIHQRPVEEGGDEGTTQADGILLPGENAGGEVDANAVENNGEISESGIAEIVENGVASIQEDEIPLSDEEGNQAQEVDQSHPW